MIITLTNKETNKTKNYILSKENNELFRPVRRGQVVTKWTFDTEAKLWSFIYSTFTIEKIEKVKTKRPKNDIKRLEILIKNATKSALVYSNVLKLSQEEAFERLEDMFFLAQSFLFMTRKQEVKFIYKIIGKINWTGEAYVETL